MKVKCFLERAQAPDDVRVLYAAHEDTLLQHLIEQEYGVTLRVKAFQVDDKDVVVVPENSSVISPFSEEDSWHKLESVDKHLKLLQVWLLRLDASGARTPPHLATVLETEFSTKLKESLSDLSLKETDAKRVHNITPPMLSPVDSSEDDAEYDSSMFSLTRGRSGSMDMRTPPGTPPLSPKRMSPRREMKVSSESSAASSPAFLWGERLLVSPGESLMSLRPTTLKIRPERFNLLETSSDMSLSGHQFEIGFEKSEKELGHGAFGKVWLGLRDNGGFLAIKEIQLQQGEKYAERLEAVENEIEMMRSFDHPHIVRYLGSKRDESKGAFYILLEYVSCGSIQALIKNMGGPLDERVIRKYARQILLGLAYLHSRNPPVVHRDIKSANVLVETTGNVKLADFGCSKVVSDLLDGYASVLGTPHWMPPEVIRQEGAGLAADIWSFGCTVLEMATGQPPWSHIRDPTAVMFHVASTSELPAMPDSLSDAGKDFVRLCLQRDPSKRPSAAELLLHPFVSSDHITTASLRDVQGTEKYLNSLATQSLVTMPQFLSVLPANLVVYIFQFLPLADLLSVAAVCRQWRAAASTDSLWEVKAKDAWPWLSSNKGNRWKDIYVEGVKGNGWKGTHEWALDTLRGHGKHVRCLDGAGDRLVVGGEDKKIRVWNTSKKKCLLTLRGHSKAVTAVRLWQDRVLSGGVEGTVRLWETSKGKCLKALEGHQRGGVVGVDMAGSVGVSASVGGGVRVWDLEAGTAVAHYSCPSNVQAHSIRYDGQTRVVVGCGDGVVRVWDTRQKNEGGSLSQHSDRVSCVRVGAPQHRLCHWQHLLCSGSADGTVRLWDVRTLKSFSVLSVPDDTVESLDFDSSILAAGGKGRTLHVWDLASEEPLRTLQQHSDVISGVSVGGGRIFTCSKDRTVKILSCTASTSTTPAERSSANKAVSFFRALTKEEKK